MEKKIAHHDPSLPLARVQAKSEVQAFCLTELRAKLLELQVPRPRARPTRTTHHSHCR